MRPFLTDHYGNPSSGHWAGAPAKEAVEEARTKVARLVGCQSDEVVFTSGGTESNNHAIRGAFFALRDHGNHVITTQVEHPSVIAPCRFIEKMGAEVTFLPVDGFGRVGPDDVRKAVTGGTILISVMHANNEVGSIQPIAEIGRIAHEHGILFHTDAAQSVGKITTRVEDLAVRPDVGRGAQGLCAQRGRSPLHSTRYQSGTIRPRSRTRGGSPCRNGKRPARCGPGYRVRTI